MSVLCVIYKDRNYNKIINVMFKFTLKILTVFALFTAVSCAMEDEDSEVVNNKKSNDSYYDGNYTDFLVTSAEMLSLTEQSLYMDADYSGQLVDDTAFYFDPFSNVSSLDTAGVFPNDTTFHSGVMKCIANSYGMGFRIVNSLFNPKLRKEDWMSLTTPYLGTFTSPLDSRIKQWEVLEDASYSGVDYQYCLKITDMPGGGMSKDLTQEKDPNKDNAVEFFYNENLQKGVIVFSPVNYDRVKYPEYFFSKDMKCLLRFVSNKDSIVNELFITGYSSGIKSVYGIDNVYLKFSEIRGSGYIRFFCLIDMPGLWFDAVANAGYCICVAGTADKDNNCAVFYTGLVRNSSAETSVTKLIGENPSGYVLGRLYPAWYRMTTGEVGAKDTTLFQNPAYYSNSLYKGCGKAGAAVYQKAVNNTIDLLNGKTDSSPYQNSINKVLW